MKRRWFRAILLSLGLIAFAMACCYGAFYYIEKSIEKFEKSKNPPMALEESDLVGTWKADYDHYYDGGIDTLILKANGTFKQIYENRSRDYIFETPWNKWWLERLPDGRVRIHLKGARYYLHGIREAEEKGIDSFVDPFAFHQGKPAMWYPGIDENETSIVHMVGELVLNIRVLPSGELVLAHMWVSLEEAWGDVQLFHRVETLSPPQTPTP